MKNNKESLISYIRVLLRANELYLEKIRANDTSPFQAHDFYISIVLNAWAAFEGYINFISSIAKFAQKLESYEHSFLEESEWRLNDKGKFEKNTLYRSTTKKFLFLLSRFSSIDVDKFRRGQLWNDINLTEEKRNLLTHPKEEIDFESIDLKIVEKANKTVHHAIIFLEKEVLKIKRSNIN